MTGMIPLSSNTWYGKVKTVIDNVNFQRELGIQKKRPNERIGISKGRTPVIWLRERLKVWLQIWVASWF